MKRSSAERDSVNVVLIDDRLHHLHDRDSFENENEGGAESDRLNSAESRAFHDSPLTETRTELTILNDSSWRTDRRKLNQGNKL